MKLYQYYKNSPTQQQLRVLVFVASFASTIFLLAALVGQYGFHMHPCELCIAQRVPYCIIAMLGTVAGMKLKSEQKLRSVALACAWLFLAEAGIATYHSGVEMGYIKGPSACTNSDKPGQTLEEMRAAIMHAQLVPCDQPMDYFFGLSMASWNALVAAVMAIATFVAIAQTARKRANKLHEK